MRLCLSLRLVLVSLGLGIIGIPLPILPTTPFYCYRWPAFAPNALKLGSTKTKLYQTYVADWPERPNRLPKNGRNGSFFRSTF